MRNNLPLRKIVLSLFVLICFSSLTFAQSTDLPIDNVIVGSVDDANDFTATVSLSWDADSIYMSFIVTDDSIVNGGTQYQVDNIEVYLDLDNSKNVHWPRNGGWSADDATFDDNDYQFRLVPDSAFSANNGFEGATQIYTRTDTGYNFELSIEWNSLMADFSQVSGTLEQVSGTLIGFDALISDNDAEASDDNRNQITFNSSTDKAFNDPSLWSTIELSIVDSLGVFNVIPDEVAPSVPENVTATVTGYNVDLKWDASTDNTGVLFYTVTLDGTEQDPVYAQADGEVTLGFSDLEVGTYSFAVKATDNNGNESDYATAVDAEVVTAKDLKDVVFEAYPNPASSILYIKDADAVVDAEIISVNGSVVARIQNNNSQDIAIDVSGLKEGMYILKINTIDGKVATSKIIKE